MSQWKTDSPISNQNFCPNRATKYGFIKPSQGQKCGFWGFKSIIYKLDGSKPDQSHFQVQLVCGSIIMTHFKQMEIGDGVSLLEIW